MKSEEEYPAVWLMPGNLESLDLDSSFSLASSVPTGFCEALRESAHWRETSWSPAMLHHYAHNLARDVIGRREPAASSDYSIPEELARLRQEQSRLRILLQTLEHRLDEMLAMHDGEAPIDPYTRWLENNLDQLQQYPDEWVALDPQRGIVFHSADGDAFDAWLDELPADEDSRLMVLHTSTYV